MTNQWEIPSAKLSLVIRIGAALDLLLIPSQNTGDFRYFELSQATIAVTVRAENSGRVSHVGQYGEASWTH